MNYSRRGRGSGTVAVGWPRPGLVGVRLRPLPGGAAPRRSTSPPIVNSRSASSVPSPRICGVLQAGAGSMTRLPGPAPDECGILPGAVAAGAIQAASAGSTGAGFMAVVRFHLRIAPPRVVRTAPQGFGKTTLLAQWRHDGAGARRVRGVGLGRSHARRDQPAATPATGTRSITGASRRTPKRHWPRPAEPTTQTGATHE